MIIHVTSDDILRKVWPDVRPGIEHILRKTDKPMPWIVEDVYHAIRSRHSTMFVGYAEDGAFEGLIVLHPITACDGIEANVWLFYLTVPLEQVLPLWDTIKAFCVSVWGARRIVMSSTRKGWGRRIAKTGMLPTTQNYSLDLRKHHDT